MISALIKWFLIWRNQPKGGSTPTPTPKNHDPITQLLQLHANATPGNWSSNCAGEIFAMWEGEEVRIGHFQGNAKDAAAVCAFHNHATALLKKQS